MTPRAKVAVVKTTPETVLDDIERVMTLADYRDHLDPDATTILKDNISWHYPMPGANTTPWQMEGVARTLIDGGFQDLVCVQNKTVVINAFKGEDLNNYVPIFHRYEIPVRYNFREGDMEWVPYTPKAEMRALDHIYPEGIRIPDYLIGKNIVHLPTVKCHIYTTTTGAMKNAFGGLLSTHRHYTHTWIHETLRDLLAIQQEIHPGIFAVMDGTTAGDGPGPRLHRPVKMDILLASADQVAIDAVAAKLMGFDPMDIGYIRLAHEDGLGVGDVSQIELVGDEPPFGQYHFKLGFDFHRVMAWFAWYGPTKFLQKLVLRTPLVIFPILYSETYHDYIRWPLKERGVYHRWLDESPWGKLFQKYQERNQALQPPGGETTTGL
jgi:uncharacterized protein (DUF362 family)